MVLITRVPLQGIECSAECTGIHFYPIPTFFNCNQGLRVFPRILRLKERQGFRFWKTDRVSVFGKGQGLRTSLRS